MFMDNVSTIPYVYEIRTRDFQLVKEAVKTTLVESNGGLRTVSAPPNFYAYNGPRIRTRAKFIYKL